MSIVAGKKYDDPDSTKHIADFVDYYNINTEEMLETLESFKVCVCVFIFVYLCGPFYVFCLYVDVSVCLSVSISLSLSLYIYLCHSISISLHALVHDTEIVRK